VKPVRTSRKMGAEIPAIANSNILFSLLYL